MIKIKQKKLTMQAGINETIIFPKSASIPKGLMIEENLLLKGNMK